MTSNNRLANIDLLRTIAIILVVFYHAVNMSKTPTWFWKIAETGSLGVDLFFVLSGFLVGTLYIKEWNKFGNVLIVRFIGRRIFRTLPMYFIILLIAYFAAYMVKRITFSWTYLFFLQNYLIEMPYYTISWSLCVEEHFYIVLPFALPLFRFFNNITNYFVIFILFFIPLIFRYYSLDGYTNTNTFGFYRTATHFRYEGLYLGVLTAFLLNYKIKLLPKNILSNHYILFLTPLSMLLVSILPDKIRYLYSYSYFAIIFATLLINLYLRQPLKIASTRLNHTIAVASYSIYLTHSLVIHICVKFFQKINIDAPIVTIPIMFIFSLLIGYFVYLFAEKPIMLWRDILIPTKVHIV